MLDKCNAVILSSMDVCTSFVRVVSSYSTALKMELRAMLISYTNKFEWFHIQIKINCIKIETKIKQNFRKAHQNEADDQKKNTSKLFKFQLFNIICAVVFFSCGNLIKPSLCT